jgi:hypothetical protein
MILLLPCSEPAAGCLVKSKPRESFLSSRDKEPAAPACAGNAVNLVEEIRW